MKFLNKKKKVVNVQIKLRSVYKESLILYLIFWTYKNLGLLILKTIFTEKKAIKILRRILFEVEWRLRGDLVYSKYGWSSKLFDVF